MTEQELLQVPKELRELFLALDKQGWNPQLCDTLVPYYANGVPCGIPSEVGDIRHDEYDLMPRDMVALNQTFTFNAYGDSMVGAGIDHGDRLEMLSTPVARHGDIVLASVGDGYTVKSYFVDDLGRGWLVPANSKYKAMLITEERRVRIEGRVVSVRKLDPRADNRAMRNAVLASEEYAPASMGEVCGSDDETKSSREQVARAVKSAFCGVEGTITSTDWIATYWVLTTYAGAPTSFSAFAKWASDLQVEGAPLCKADLLRKADAVFQKPTDRWNECCTLRDSVVQRRLQIAQALKKELGV